MKNVLLSLGLLSLVATACVADMKMENVNLGEIQVGKFYGNGGVSFNSAPSLFHNETTLFDSDLALTTVPHINLGYADGFMGEIGVTNQVALLNTEIKPSLFYGTNLKTFKADKKVSHTESTLNATAVDQVPAGATLLSHRIKHANNIPGIESLPIGSEYALSRTTLNVEDTTSDRYTDVTIRVGEMLQYENYSLMAGVEKGVLTGDIDFEKFAAVSVITNSGCFTLEVRKTDLGDTNANTFAVSYSTSF